MNEYLENQVLTASPVQLHLMVVEGALQSARAAAEELRMKQFDGVHRELNRSREFVNEMISGLNDEHSREMVETLKALFTYIYQNLVRAEFEHSPELIDSAAFLLEQHRDTWRELMLQLANQPTETAVADIPAPATPAPEPMPEAIEPPPTMDAGGPHFHNAPPAMPVDDGYDEYTTREWAG